jgi:C4-dicarboxylate-specific signal transduction histidine kinase
MGATLLAREPRVLGGRLMAALVSQATHDLNNHLTAMLGKAEFGLLVADPERKTAALSGVLEAGDAARRLVADLQRLAAYSEGAGDAVPAAEVAQLATRLLDRRLKRAGIAVTCRGSGPGPLRPRAAAAALALWCALRRLLEDAGGAAPRTLELSVRCAGRDGEIAVRIDGAVLSAHTLDALDGSLAEAGARIERHGGQLLVVLP